MSKNKEYIFDKAANLFDLPGEVVAGMSRVTITGGSRVFIENHKGILEYGEERIGINGGRVVISVTGSDLEIRSMNTSELLITGRVHNVSFER